MPNAVGSDAYCSTKRCRSSWRPAAYVFGSYATEKIGPTSDFDVLVTYAQQASEMALKAALIAVSDDHPRTHVGKYLIRELVGPGEDVPKEIVDAANSLDMYYVGSRYPDALGGAIVALERAKAVVTFAASIVEQVAAEPA